MPGAENSHHDVLLQPPQGDVPDHLCLHLLWLPCPLSVTGKKKAVCMDTGAGVEEWGGEAEPPAPLCIVPFSVPSGPRAPLALCG